MKEVSLYNDTPKVVKECRQAKLSNERLQSR